MENAENSEAAGAEDMSLPAQQQAVCYSLSDEEEQDEEDELSEVEDFASDARKIKERLSTMFEHNDLINNRMAVLTKAIREGPLQPADRQPSRRASMPARPVPRPSGDFHTLSDIQPSVLLERCQQLEQLVRELKQENQHLRGQTKESAAAPAQGPEESAAPTASAAAEKAAGHDFIGSMPSTTPTRKTFAGYVQEKDEPGAAREASSGLWAKARNVVSASAALEDSLETRRQLRRDLRMERAQRKRLERELGSLRGELAKCESIVEQLMEEIEDRGRGAEPKQSELMRAEARAIIEGKLGREKEPPGAVLVDDLKDADRKSVV